LKFSLFCKSILFWWLEEFITTFRWLQIYCLIVSFKVKELHLHAGHNHTPLMNIYWWENIQELEIYVLAIENKKPTILFLPMSLKIISKI
jgi:hypothetical protein